MRFKKVLGYLELEGQGHGIIRGHFRSKNEIFYTLLHTTVRFQSYSLYIETVENLSRISQFHDFFQSNSWRVLVIWPNCEQQPAAYGYSA